MSVEHNHQPATIKRGSVILHRKYKCEVLYFGAKDVGIKRISTGLVLHVPYNEMPTWAIQS